MLSSDRGSTLSRASRSNGLNMSNWHHGCHNQTGCLPAPTLPVCLAPTSAFAEQISGRWVAMVCAAATDPEVTKCIYERLSAET